MMARYRTTATYDLDLDDDTIVSDIEDGHLIEWLVMALKDYPATLSLKKIDVVNE